MPGWSDDDLRVVLNGRVNPHKVITFGVGDVWCWIKVDIVGIVTLEPFDNGAGEVDSGLVREWEAATKAWVHLQHIIIGSIGAGEYIYVEVAYVL